MIRGQQMFTEHFALFEDCYIVIGGLAVNAILEGEGLTFRTTKDFDIILVVEALRPEFFEAFKSFIEKGGYRQKEVVEEKRQYYRFTKPSDKEYPHQIELFSRKPDVIPDWPGALITPIPIDEVAASLSAILMDDAYYSFTLENSDNIDGMHIANQAALICLKIRAYLDLSKRKIEGDQVNSKDIKKHKNDVFRLGATITGSEVIEVPDVIHSDIVEFLDKMEKENPDLSSVFKLMGLSGKLQGNEILEALKVIFKKT